MCDIGAGSTRSVAITLTVTLTIWWFGGQRVFGDAVIETIVGGVVSTTVTVNEPCAVLLCASVAVHCTVVVPRGNVDPDAGLQVTATEPSTISAEVALKLTAAPPGPVASAVRLAGSESTGGVVSRTVT